MGLSVFLSFHIQIDHLPHYTTQEIYLSVYLSVNVCIVNEDAQLLSSFLLFALILDWVGKSLGKVTETIWHIVLDHDEQEESRKRQQLVGFGPQRDMTVART